MQIQYKNEKVGILLVEDDDGDAKAVQRAFKKAKISNPIIRAIDGIEALEILRDTHENKKISRPLLMLVDLNMPRMNGIELVAELRNDERLKGTVVFILTTSDREEDINASYNLNVSGYILKSTAGLDFLSLVRMIDNYWHVVELPR